MSKATFFDVRMESFIVNNVQPLCKTLQEVVVKRKCKAQLTFLTVDFAPLEILG